MTSLLALGSLLLPIGLHRLFEDNPRPFRKRRAAMILTLVGAASFLVFPAALNSLASPPIERGSY